MPIHTNNKLEEDQLKKFRKITEDLQQDDVTLLRFLIATGDIYFPILESIPIIIHTREYKLENAEAMLRQCIKWRTENNVDSLLNWDVPQYLRTDTPYRITGLDYEGGPIIWIPIGRFNHRPYVEQGLHEEMYKYGTYLIEDGLRSIKCTAGGRQQATLIIDLEQLSYYQAAHLGSLKLIHSIFKALEQYYPEVLRRITIINAPWIFSIPFNFIKGILSAHTISKLKVFDSNKNNWMSHLLEVAPKKCLPEEYFEDENGN